MASHGSITTNPWSNKYVGENSENWESVWPEIDHKNVDPLQAAADYYLLFGIVNNAFLKFEPLRLPNPNEVVDAAIKLGLTMNDMIHRIKRVNDILSRDPRKELTEICDAANNLLVELVERLDPVFRGYVYMACGGELRHHRAIGGMALSANRSAAWCSYRKIVEEYGFEDVLNTTAKYFRDFNSSSYGSEKWAQATELLLEREKGELGPNKYLNKMLFVDRVFTLEHNGGCFLNKIEWHNSRIDRGSPYNYGVNNMKAVVLDAHCSNPPNVLALYKTASSEVQDLIKSYFSLAMANSMTVSVDVSCISTVPVTNDKELTDLLDNTQGTSVYSTKVSDYFDKSMWTISKYGEIMDPDAVPFSYSMPLENSLHGVSASFSVEVLYEGNTWSIFKDYDVSSIMALTEKNFYWKHMVKSVYPGSEAQKMNMVISWGPYRIKAAFENYVPSTVYGQNLAKLFAALKSYDS